MYQGPSIRKASAIVIKYPIELERNLEQGLGPMNINENITHLNQPNESPI